MKENKMKYEYEALKVGDADAILIRHYGATDKPCGEGVRTLTQNCC